MVLSAIAVAIAAIILLQLVIFIYKTMVRPSDFPPGPRSVPILGSLHLLGVYPERGMLELAMKYGNIFSLKLGSKDFVCVCGFEANRDAMMKMKLTDRRVIYAFNIAKGSSSSGLIHNEHSPSLVAYREMTHDLFAGKIRVKYTHEMAARESVSKAMKDFETFARLGEAAPVTEILSDIGLDVVMKILFGDGIQDPAENNYPEIMKLRKDISDLPKYSENSFMIPEIIPALPKFLFPKSSKKFLDTSKKIMDYAKKQLEKHKETYHENNLRDFIDFYLMKMRKEEENGKSGNAVFTENNLLSIIYDFFIAGVANMFCATGFATLYLAGHKEIQRRLHDEIFEEFETRSSTVPSDMNKMPYTKATTFEVFRYSNISPNGVPRKASKPFKFHGYSIPKGTTFLLNTYSSHFQQDKWSNAMNFDPKNFLNKSGEFQPNEAYMPFGLGLRKCPGESLMENFLFVYIVSLVQRFEIRPDSELDLEPLPGLVATPKPQKVRLVPRFDKLHR